jgi:hypothetical protein
LTFLAIPHLAKFETHNAEYLEHVDYRQTHPKKSKIHYSQSFFVSTPPPSSQVVAECWNGVLLDQLVMNFCLIPQDGRHAEIQRRHGTIVAVTQGCGK